MEAMQRRAKRRQNTRRGIIVAIVAVVVLGTGALLFAGKSPTTTTTTTHVDDSAHDDDAPWPRPLSPSRPSPTPNAAGVSGKSPTLVVPAGAPPTKPELANLITGTGPGIVLGDTFTAQYVLADYHSRKVLQTSWTTGPFSGTLSTNNLICGLGGGNGGHEGGRSTRVDPAAG